MRLMTKAAFGRNQNMRAECAPVATEETNSRKSERLGDPCSTEGHTEESGRLSDLKETSSRAFAACACILLLSWTVLVLLSVGVVCGPLDNTLLPTDVSIVTQIVGKATTDDVPFNGFVLTASARAAKPPLSARTAAARQRVGITLYGRSSTAHMASPRIILEVSLPSCDIAWALIVSGEQSFSPAGSTSHGFTEDIMALYCKQAGMDVSSAVATQAMGELVSITRQLAHWQADLESKILSADGLFGLQVYSHQFSQIRPGARRIVLWTGTGVWFSGCLLILWVSRVRRTRKDPL